MPCGVEWRRIRRAAVLNRAGRPHVHGRRFIRPQQRHPASQLPPVYLAIVSHIEEPVAPRGSGGKAEGLTKRS